jgi:SAM-dependent methyltransferase
MHDQLPSPDEIADHYNRRLRALGGQYIHSRWGNSEIKRRHYKHTEKALRFGLARVEVGGDILEIGSGPAVWTPLYLSAARSIHLLDISEEMLQAAKTRLADLNAQTPPTRFTVGDFLKVDVASNEYDTIVSSRAFEYMSSKKAFAEKCFTSLRPGGRLVLVTKNGDWRDLVRLKKQYAGKHREEIPFDDAMQLDLMKPQDALELFEAAGFRNVTVYPVIVGTYEGAFSRRVALPFADFVQGRWYRTPLKSLPRLLSSFTESFLLTATK